MNIAILFTVSFQFIFFFGFMGLFILKEPIQKWTRDPFPSLRRMSYIWNASSLRSSLRIGLAYYISMMPVAVATEIIGTSPFGAAYVTATGLLMLEISPFLLLFRLRMKKEKPIPLVREAANIVFIN